MTTTQTQWTDGSCIMRVTHYPETQTWQVEQTAPEPTRLLAEFEEYPALVRWMNDRGMRALPTA